MVRGWPLAGRAVAAWRRRWFPKASLADLAVARVILAATVLYLNGAIRFLGVAHAPRLAWHPIPLIDLLGIGPPDLQRIRLLQRLTRAALIAAAAGFLTSVALLAAFALQLVQEAFLNCFGKVSHSTIPLLYAMLFFACAPCGRAWSVDAWLRRRYARLRDREAATPRTSRFARWPFELLFVELAFYYFDAGLSKLSASGLAWADGYTLQYHLVKQNFVVGRWVAPHLGLCALLSAGALLFELGFPLAIVVRRLRPLILASGVLFHLANHLMLNLIFWPVMAVYPLVVPWSAIARAWGGDGRSSRKDACERGAT